MSFVLPGNVNIGSNSCIGGTYACYYFQGISIGDNSCTDYAACYQKPYTYLKHKGTIGDNSCNGEYSCAWYASRNTGDNSCNGKSACRKSTGKSALRALSAVVCFQEIQSSWLISSFSKCRLQKLVGTCFHLGLFKLSSTLSLITFNSSHCLAITRTLVTK